MFMFEYSLLVAVALPVAVVLAINAILALSGEKGTLLLPSLGGYPPVEIPAIDAAIEPVRQVASVEDTPVHAEELRQAA